VRLVIYLVSFKPVFALFGVREYSAAHAVVTPRVRRRVKMIAVRFAKDVYIVCKVFIIISFLIG
jgi:hypothetical protein